ncbi:MAG: glycosyltransferase family 4 protein [Deltaproteobacteria bacterium]|nr:glycosyltransferase family 4 protein [Deltaproteobacteria bacterium]
MKDVTHVLSVTDAFYPEHGGVERVSFELARAMVRRGVRVTALARRADGRPDGEEIDGVRVMRFSVPPRIAPLVYLGHMLSSRRKAARLLTLDRPDVAHLHLSLSAQGPLSVMKNAGVPIVAGFFGPWYKEFAAELADRGTRASAYLRWQMTAQKKLQRRLLTGADGVVVLSDFSREELRALAPEADGVTVKIPGGFDPNLFRPLPKKEARATLGLEPGPPIVFTARRLVHRMGLDLLVDAVALLAKRGRRVRLIIAGAGPLRETLETRAKGHGLADDTTFPGFVTDDELALFYNACDVFVVPTRAQENFGLPVLEAAACGCPVVSTDAGSLPEVMGAAE